MHKEFINEIKNDERSVNDEIFKGFFYSEDFFDHTPLFLAKELYNSNQRTNDEIVKHINSALIELKKNIYRKILLKMKMQVTIVEKILDFNKQQKGKGLPSDLARMALLAKVSNHSNLKISTP